jgi:hypothetical protein
MDVPWEEKNNPNLFKKQLLNASVYKKLAITISVINKFIYSSLTLRKA